MKLAASGKRGVFWRANPRGTQELRQPGGGRVRGDWWICWYCTLGHKHREPVGAKSVAQQTVEQRRTKARSEGFCLTASKQDRPVPFSEIVDDYVRYQETHNRPPHNDCVRIRYWKDRWGERPVTNITREDVEQGKLALMDHRDPQRTPGRHETKRTYEPATVVRYLAALRCCFNVAIRNGKAPTNPVVGTRFPRENNGRLKYLPSPEAERALLDAVPDARRQEMVEVAIHTGLRWSEQRGLRWRDCDFMSGILTIPRSKHGETRYVPMNSRVREMLMDMGTRRLPHGDEHVFRGADGQAPPQKADRWFPRAVAKARHALTQASRHADVEMLDGFTWHCLRHTFASRLAMAGVDLLVIKELGGWKTLAMVMRYAHLSPGRLREGIERLVCAPAPDQKALRVGSDTVSDTTVPDVVATAR